MFATKRASPKINADDVAPSYVLFLTCRGEKYVRYYIHTVIWWQLLLRKPLGYKCNNSFTWGGGHQCITWTSLQPGPMWISTGPYTTSHWPHSPSPSLPPFPPRSPYMKNNFFQTMKTTSVDRKHPLSGPPSMLNMRILLVSKLCQYPGLIIWPATASVLVIYI